MKERPASSKQRYLIEPRFDEAGNQISSGILYNGQEAPDGVPMAPPIGYEAPTQLEQLIEQLIRRRDFNAAVAAAGSETFEEADDFDVDEEDYDPRFGETIYEKYFEAKSKRAAQQAARQAEANRTASADLASEQSAQKKVETPISGDAGDKSSKVEPLAKV